MSELEQGMQLQRDIQHINRMLVSIEMKVQNMSYSFGLMNKTEEKLARAEELLKIKQS